MYSPKRRRFPWFFLLLIALVAAGAWWWLGKTGGEPGKSSGQSILIKTAPVERHDMSREFREVGTVAAYETVSLRARVDSQVAQVLFKDGAEVKAGDTLFLLDDRTLKADYQRQRALEENARVQLDRAKRLSEAGAASKAQLDQARADYTLAKANADSARAQLSYTRITAPISGRTGTINVTQGNNVRAGDANPLVTINQVKPIRVRFTLPQAAYDTVRTSMNAGTPMVSALREGGAEAAGTLEYIDNTIDQASGTFAARAVFPNENEALWPGMFVTVLLNAGEEKAALTVPEPAIQRGQEEEFVFAVREGKAARVPVKLKRVQEGLAVIEGELQEGEAVAVDGLMSLREGSAVKVGEEKSEADKASALPKE